MVGRILHQRINKEWLAAQSEFLGWDHYTGYFTVFDLQGEVLYETFIEDGKSIEIEETNENGRTSGYTCITTTTKICKGNWEEPCLYY